LCFWCCKGGAVRDDLKMLGTSFEEANEWVNTFDLLLVDDDTDLIDMNMEPSAETGTRTRTRTGRNENRTVSNRE
jgi:hypothetical protein